LSTLSETPLIIAALDARVVVDAHAGDDGHLLAAQSRDAPRAVDAQAHVIWGELGSPCGQELANLAPGVHSARVFAWGVPSIPGSTGTLTWRRPVLL
jgi:hypothetical protein